MLTYSFIRKRITFLNSLLLIGPLLWGQSTSFPLQLDYLASHAENPATYVSNKFKVYDLVILGEDHAIRQNLQFVSSLIPHLYQAGVFNLGIEFGASEMQELVDSLVNAPQYDQEGVRSVMYYYNVGWAYQEYMDLYKSVWAFNRNLPQGARRFRILNLSYQYDWSGFTPPRTPQNLGNVFTQGAPDAYRFGLIENEIIRHHEKMLIYVGTPHAFTRYHMAFPDIHGKNFCRYDAGFLGNRIYQKYPGKVFTILLHQPFANIPGKSPFLLSPGNGAVEKIMSLNGNHQVGFNLVGTPMGALTDSSNYSTCHQPFKLADLFDGYIFLCPFQQMDGCSIDPDFFENHPWSETERQQPDPDWHQRVSSQQEFWARIKEFVNIRERYASLKEVSQ